MPAPAAANNRAPMGRAASLRMTSPPPPPPPAAAFAPPPPPTVQPVLAEGVPVSRQAGEAAAPAKQDSAAQEKPHKKKKKKKEEAPPEVFEDELEDVSESEEEEALTGEEKAVKTEKEVKKKLCFAILSACGVVFMITLISKLLQRFSNAEYAGEDEFINAAGVNTGGPIPPPPVGAETALNVGVAQQMAVAASQSAAAGTAAGGSAAATAAAAAATASAVTSVTSAAGVTATAMVAVTGVGMAAGIVPVPAFLLGKPVHPCHVFLDELTPHKGHLNLHLKNLPPNYFNVPHNTPAIEMAFTEAFNKVLGSCVAHSIEGHNDTTTDANNTQVDDEIPQDVYARFLQNATLEGWDFWQVVDGETGKNIKYFTTEWSAFVGCDDNGGESFGCSDLEPLFYDDDIIKDQEPNFDIDSGVQFNTTRRQLFLNNPYARWLEDTTLVDGKDQSNLQLFMDSFAFELQELLEKSPNPNDADLEPNVFYGASLAANDTHTIVESEGVRYLSGSFLAGKGEGGAVDRPRELPICTLPDGNPNPNLQLKEGYLHIGLKGMDETFFNNAKQLIRQEFREVYNDIMGGCKGDYSRVLEKAEIEGVSAWEEQGQWLLSTNWSAWLTCDGCPDIEPLFYVLDGNGNPVSSSRDGGVGRQLEISSESKVAQFANAFATKLTKLYKSTNKPGGVIEVYYAALVDRSGVIVGEAVGEKQPFGAKHEILVDCSTGEPPESVDELEEGKFELYVKDLVKDMNKDILGAVMQDIYNEETEMCNGPLQRVAHRLTIDNMEQVVVDDTEIFVGMNMTTKLTCTGCDKLSEPMFGEGEEGAARRLQEAMFGRFQSKLTTQLNLLLTDFEQTPYYEEGVSLFTSTDPNAQHKPVDVVYGATYDKSGKVTHYGTPVHNNIFEPKEELRAGSDVIVSAETCEKDLLAADAIPRDHGLKEEEYFVFVRSLFASVSPTMTWPQLGAYSDLPPAVQETFDNFQQGGIMRFGEKKNEGASDERRQIRVEAICYYTSHAIKDSIKGETVTEAPTTLAPVTSPPTTAGPMTMPPTTAAPTTTTPTSAPSESPTASAAPTETRVVTIMVEWAAKLDEKREIRDATQAEYEKFSKSASEWLTESMTEAYELHLSLNFESQTTEFTSSQYHPTIQEIVTITRSNFVFRGTQPTAKSIFEVLDQQDLEPFLKSLWVLDPTDPDPWIFDNAVGLTVATAREG